MPTLDLGQVVGSDGAAAGFGTVSATVDANTGTPGVSVSTSGPNTAKNISFTFTNLKGNTGSTGAAGPNTVSSSTSTSLNGVLAGNGSTVTTKTVDSNPTASSTNLVTSGGAYKFSLLKATLGANDDLNNIVIPGLYGWGSTAPANAPSTYAWMLVCSRPGDSGYTSQYVRRGNTDTNDRIYERHYTNSTNGWTSWVQIGLHGYDSNPAMDSTASAGTSIFFARGDHVHPRDTRIDEVSFRKTTSLVTADDLNNITTAGMYGWSTTYPSNSPVTGAGWMLVLSRAADDGFPNQYVRPRNSSNVIYERYYNPNDSTWSSWVTHTNLAGATYYGDVKLSDSTTSTLSTSDATAATPAAVKAVKDAIPTAYTSNPAANGSASAGSSTSWSRGDHVHPTDTSRAPTSHAVNANTYGLGTNGVYGHLKLSDSTTSTSSTNGGIAATPAAVKAVKDAIPTVPSAYTSNPKMDGTAAAGSATTWAKGDHVHPSDTSRAPIVKGTLTIAKGGSTETLDLTLSAGHSYILGIMAHLSSSTHMGYMYIVHMGTASVGKVQELYQSGYSQSSSYPYSTYITGVAISGSGSKITITAHSAVNYALALTATAVQIV